MIMTLRRFVLVNHSDGRSAVVGDSDLDLRDVTMFIVNRESQIKKKLEVR